jgi:hypothetical protein
MFIWLRNAWMPVLLLLGISAGLINGDWCPASILIVLALIGVLDEVVVRMAALGERPPMPSCHRCGYDLTGNTSGTCPECGTPVSSRR